MYTRQRGVTQKILIFSQHVLLLQKLHQVIDPVILNHVKVKKSKKIFWIPLMFVVPLYRGTIDFFYKLLRHLLRIFEPDPVLSSLSIQFAAASSCSSECTTSYLAIGASKSLKDLVNVNFFLQVTMRVLVESIKVSIILLWRCRRTTNFLFSSTSLADYLDLSPWGFRFY